MNTESVKIICKTITMAVCILAWAGIFTILFMIGMWPFAILQIMFTLIALLVYFIIYLIKNRAKKKNEEIEQLKQQIEKLKRKEYIENLVKESDAKRGHQNE